MSLRQPLTNSVMKRTKSSHRVYSLSACLLCLVIVLLRNRFALREGLVYMGQMLAWNPDKVTPITVDGRFGILYDFVAGTNGQRCYMVEQDLIKSGLSPLRIPSCDDCPPNLLVTFGQRGPYRLILAHYDKSRETPEYQGASDNSAAVAVLLALADELAATPPETPLALLFTSGEEKGLLGARALLRWCDETGFEIESVIGIDMIGRDRLAVRPLGHSGLHFWLPLAGNRVFDGQATRSAAPCRQPDPSLVRQLRQASAGELVVYRTVAGNTDALPFAERGLPTAYCAGSNTYYANLVWEQDTDRIELLDEDSLQQTLDTFIAYAHLTTP